MLLPSVGRSQAKQRRDVARSSTLGQHGDLSRKWRPENEPQWQGRKRARPDYDPSLARRTGRSVAVLEGTGHTQGWLLTDPDNSGDWFPAWVVLDPEVPLLLVQLGHRHRVADGSLWTFELDRAHSHVVATSNNVGGAASFAANAHVGLHAFRVHVRENISFRFAASAEGVARTWIAGLRAALEKRHCAPPQVDFDPPRWRARPKTPLKTVCDHFFYEHLSRPGNGAAARADLALKCAMRACGIAFAWDPDLETWHAVPRDSPQFAAPLLQALARGFLARRRTQRLRRRRAEARRQRRLLRSKGPHDDFPHVQKVLILAPRLGNKAVTKLQALWRAHCVRGPFVAFRAAVYELTRRWKSWVARRHRAVVAVQRAVRRHHARQAYLARKFVRERAATSLGVALATRAAHAAVQTVLLRYHAARVMQASFRGHRRARAACRLQARVRGYRERRRRAILVAAATRIQARWRAHASRQEFLRKRELCRRVQSRALAVLARRRFRAMRRSSTLIAARFRTATAYRALKRKQWAATLLQRIVRIWAHVRKWRAHLRALAVTQKVARGWLVRNRRRRRARSAVSIQAFARSFAVARPAYQRKRRAATLLSKHTRAHLARQMLRRHIAAKAIQARWRGRRARRRFMELWTSLRKALVRFQASVRGALQRLRRCRHAAQLLDSVPHSERAAQDVLAEAIPTTRAAALGAVGAICGIAQAKRSLRTSAVTDQHRRGLDAVLRIREVPRCHEALERLRWLQDAIVHIQWRLPLHGPRLVVGAAAMQALASAHANATVLGNNLEALLECTRAYLLNNLLRATLPPSWAAPASVLRPHRHVVARIEALQERLQEAFESTREHLENLVARCEAAVRTTETHGAHLVDDIERAARGLEKARIAAWPASLAVFAAAQRLERHERHLAPCAVDEARVALAQIRLERRQEENIRARLPEEAATKLHEALTACKSRLEARFAEFDLVRDAVSAATQWAPLVLEFVVVETMAPRQTALERAAQLDVAHERFARAHSRLQGVLPARCLTCRCAGDDDDDDDDDGNHHLEGFRVELDAAKTELERAVMDFGTVMPSMGAIDFAGALLDELAQSLRTVDEAVRMWAEETSSLLLSHQVDRQHIRGAFADRAKEVSSRLARIHEREVDALALVRRVEASPSGFWWWPRAAGKRVLPSALDEERARVAAAIRQQTTWRRPLGDRGDSVDEDDNDEDVDDDEDDDSGDSLSTCSCSSCARERFAPAGAGFFEELLAERLQKLEIDNASTARQRQSTTAVSRRTSVLNAVRASVFPKAEAARRQLRAALTLQCAVRSHLARRERRRLRDEMLARARIVNAALRIQSLRKWAPS